MFRLLIMWVVILPPTFASDKTTRWNPVLASKINFDSSKQKEVRDASEMTCSLLTAR